eukprot:9431289-Alexandrium_andersonii.AAC.1
MSASLVGSEMCIRDSGSARKRGSARCTGGAWLAALAAAFARPEGTLQPVSYTHLTLPTICSV